MSWRNAARAATWPFEPELLGHDAGEERDLARVVQDVLAVAGAELETSHQTQDLGVEIVEAELERGGFSFAAGPSPPSPSFTFSTTSSIRAG